MESTSSDLSSNAQSMQISLPAECTISWDLLTTVSERPERFFQPDLTTVGGLPIDIRVRLESGQLQWEWYQVIRKLNIPADKSYHYLNDRFVVRRVDYKGTDICIANLVKNSAFDVIPFATCNEQVQNINQRRSLESHHHNQADLCDIEILDAEIAQDVLAQCT